MSTSTINISIPDKLKAEIDSVIAADGYGNTSEFFRDLIRGHLRERQQKRLEALILAGLESPASPWTKEDLVQIKETVTARIRARTNGRK